MKYTDLTAKEKEAFHQYVRAQSTDKAKMEYIEEKYILELAIMRHSLSKLLQDIT